MNKKLQFLIPYIVLAGGILFLVLGFKGLQNRMIFSYTTGIIADIQIDYDASADGNKYDVFVRYTVDGTEYESELGEYSSSMYIGDNIDILYDPENPEVIMPASLFGIVMQLIVGIGCCVCFVMLKHKEQEFT